ncbi:MAG: putative monovalent cation/H+ antiporter subunit A [Bacteroidota bacterium]
MLLAVLSGFLFAMSLVAIGPWIRGQGAGWATLLPLGLFGYLCSSFGDLAAGEVWTETYAWAPSLGVELSFRLDGLSLLFGLLITGVGTLVFIYTSAYMKGDKLLDRFYAYLSMFMAAMLGLVLSDNVISLFVFWELTSITSFFLIGYKHKDPASRRSALLALGITGLGGMLLLAGLLMMAALTDTYSIQAMMASGIVLPEQANYFLILVFVLGGAFTKSAQFPFHYWLPAAMKAPTPVSTYLHSATMVKAGVYVLFRFSPLLSGHAGWHQTLTLVGGFTMLYAAIQALFRTDLKGILAYSTISALGILTFLIGLGTQVALLAAGVFILVHALYKATLFLVAGTLDHAAGTRDVTLLRGLGRVMLPVALAGMLASLSNAGVPPMLGFIGKDLIYEAALQMDQGVVLLTAVAVLTKLLLVYAGFVVGVRPFLGKRPEAFTHVHRPSFLLWMPPVLLGILCLVFGLFPGPVETYLARPTLEAVQAGGYSGHLKLWHGFNLVLVLSALTIGLGTIGYLLVNPQKAYEKALERLEPWSPRFLFGKATQGFEWVSRAWVGLVQRGYLRVYLLIVVGFLVLLIGPRILRHATLDSLVDQLLVITLYEGIIIIIMVVAVIFAAFTGSRLVAVAALGVMGFAISLVFVFYSAPDLAMTQFSIDTLTVILFVLVLYRLPRYLPLTNLRSKLRDGTLALAFGGLMTLLVLWVMAQPQNRETADFYSENAYTLAKGKNVVNVILVDFRGTDTLVEITVLVIAALGVFALLRLTLPPNHSKKKS